MVGHDDSNFRRTNAINGNQDLENVEGTGIPRFGFESNSWLEKPDGRMSPDDAGACMLQGSAALDKSKSGPNRHV